jgi:SNF family Na+-dependent transporter
VLVWQNHVINMCYKLTHSLLTQARLRAMGMAFFILCVVLGIYVGYGSCKSYLQVSSGYGQQTASTLLSARVYIVVCIHILGSDACCMCVAVVAGLLANECRHGRGEPP